MPLFWILVIVGIIVPVKPLNCIAPDATRHKTSPQNLQNRWAGWRIDRDEFEEDLIILN